MKRRALSLILTASMLLSLLPTAFAAAAGSTPSGNLCRPSDGVTVTATASSQEADSVRAANAIDGDTTSKDSRWGSAVGNGPNWLRIDLGTTRQVGVVRIFWERLNVLSYRLEGSTDGTAWTTLYDSPDLIAQVNETLTFDPVNVRYLRVYISSHRSTGLKGDGTESIDWNTVSLFEVEAYKDEDSIPLDPLTVLNTLTTAEVKDGKLVLTAQTEQEFAYSFAADLEQVVGAGGTVYTPLVNTQVELDVTITASDGTAVTTSPGQPFKVIVPGEHIANMGNAKPRVIPELAEWYSSSAQKGKYYTLTASGKIVAPAELEGVAQELQADIQDLFGFELPIARSGAAAGDIELAMGSGDAVAGFDEETYLMEVTDRVTITATDPTGAYWGTRSVLQALKYSGDQTIAQGTARDYPEFKVRGFVLDVGRKPISMEKLQEIVKNMAWYKLNDFHIHLNDNLIFLEDYIPGWKSNQPTTAEDYAKANDAYSAFRLESSITPESGGNALTAKDYAYDKTEFKSFIEDSAALGVNIVPEIDAPAHAKSITDAFPSLRLYNASGMNNHPYNDHLDLSEANYDRSLEVVQDIFDEYIDGGTFGATVHFGADEYYDNHAAYRRFFKDMVSYLNAKGKTPRVWGSLSYMSGGTTNGQSYDIAADSADTQGVQMNIWNTGWANPKTMYDLGFDLINVTDGPCYMVPSGAGVGDRRGYGDYLDLTSVYGWTPNCIGGTWIPASSSQMAGGAFAIWNDNIDTRASGLDEVDIFCRFFDALPVISVKMWGEGDALDRTLSELQADAAITGTAPNTDPYHERTADAALPSYDFSSGAGLTLSDAELADGALTLKGGASYAGTGLDRLGWGSELNFRIKVTDITKEGIIFESNCAYGDFAIKALPVAGDSTKWKLGFSRELYDYEFATDLPVGEWVTLTIKNGQQSTKLSVDGGAEVAAVGKFAAKANSNTRFTGKTGITNSSFQIPVARIGSRTDSFVGQIGAMSVNSPIKEEPERPQDDGTQLINLALNKPVTVSGNGTCMANNNKPSSPAPENAVDGAIEEFEDYAWIGADMTTNRDENGQQNNPQWLVVDLGENIAEINDLKPEMINIAYGRRSWATKYDIQTADSTDGPWTSLLTKTVSRDHAWGYIPNDYPNRWGGNNGDSFTASSSGIALKEDAILKRYVRLYVTEVNAGFEDNNKIYTTTGNNGQCKSVAVTEFQVFARLPQTESAENIRAYQIADDQVWLTWDQVGTTYYQVYAKAPGGSWRCVSGDEVVDGSVFIHDGYIEGTVYRVLTPASEVSSPANTNTSVVDIRGYDTSTGRVGYVDCGNADRVTLGKGGWEAYSESGSNFYGGTIHLPPGNAMNDNTTMEFVFAGTGVQVIGDKLIATASSPAGGTMSVLIDGVDIGEKVDCKATGTSNLSDQVVYEKTGLKNGVHTIKIVGDRDSGRISIDAFRVLVPARSIALSANSLTIAVGSPAASVTATVSPVNGSGPFEWTSGDPAAATVTAGDIRPDAQGRMTAAIGPVAGGSATITVADKSDPEVKAEISVTVTQPVASVALPDGQRSVTLYLGPAAGQSSTVGLTPEISPATATNKAVTYSSSNTGVATVDGSGVVTAVAAGAATIAVTTADGGKTATCAVTVKSNPTAIAVMDGESAVTESAPLVLYTNEQKDLPAGGRNSAVLTAVLAPSGVTETAVTWNRSDEQAGSLISVVRDPADPTRCTISVTGISENNVGERIIEVKSAANEAVETTFKVRVLRHLVHDVTISVAQDQTPRPGVTLEAGINQLNLDDTGMSGLTYQWCRDGAPIGGADDKTYVLTDDDIGGAISVIVTATPTDTYFYEGERTSTNTVTVGRNAAPAAPVLTATPVNGDTKGTITISDPVAGAVYEISSDKGATWTDATVEDGVISGLDEGSYQVRIKESDTWEAGRAATITITDAGKAYFTVSYTVDLEMGAVSLDKTGVEEGGSVSATVDPRPGYDIVSVTVDGEPLEGAAQDDGSTVYTVEDVAADVEFVVTLAKRQLTITHILTNGLKCSKAITGADSHTVAYGTEEVITLVAEEGYALPTSSNIKVEREDGTAFTAFTYSQNTGTITITGGVTEDLTITAAGVARTYQVAYTNMVGVTGPSGEGARIATYGRDYTAKLTPVTGYRLPQTITVKRGETVLTVETDYTYAPATGMVVIKAAAVTGDLSISAAGAPVIPVSAVSIAPASVSVAAGSTVRLTAAVQPADATEQAVVWSSGDEAVATVDSTGVVTGVAEGTTEITVTTVDGGYTAACTVEVTAPAVPDDPDPVPVVPVIPSVPDGDGTKTEVKENEDGSTTTTVTDNKTGTVTETTKREDGTVETVETKKDGTVTETTEKPDGTTEIVETKPDGTVTETTEKLDGSTEAVETKPDGTVTETATDAEGGKVEKVTTPEKDVTITATDAEGEVLAKVELPAEIPAAETRFIDVPEGHWADEAIHDMAAMEIVNGVGGDRFDMSSGMKRGDLALMLSRMSNGGDGYEMSFTDVPATKYYANGVAWAAKTGVVTGRSEDTFAPEDTITREELAVMLYRYAKLLKLDTEAAEGALDSFKDGGDTHSWAEEGVAWCVDKGVLQGKGSGVLDPRTDVTRAQVAVMLQRFIDLMK